MAWLKSLQLSPLILWRSLSSSAKPLENSSCPMVIQRHAKILLWRELAGGGQNSALDLLPMSRHACPSLALCTKFGITFLTQKPLFK